MLGIMKRPEGLTRQRNLTELAVAGVFNARVFGRPFRSLGIVRPGSLDHFGLLVSRYCKARQPRPFWSVGIVRPDSLDHFGLSVL